MVAMMSRRSGVGLAVVNGQLFAVGGFDGTPALIFARFTIFVTCSTNKNVSLQAQHT